MKNFCAEACKFQHLIISNRIQFFCSFYNSRVCGEHTVYVCVDFAFISMKYRRQCNGCCIGTASSECCDIVIFIDSLESGYDHDLSGIQFMHDAFGVYSFKSGIPVTGCRVHHNLKSIQGYSRYIQCLHCHSHQGYRHLFSCSKQHIQFSFFCVRIDRIRQCDQFICSISHCRKYNHHIMSGPIIFNAAFCHIKYPVFIGNRTAAKFLNY